VRVHSFARAHLAACCYPHLRGLYSRSLREEGAKDLVLVQGKRVKVQNCERQLEKEGEGEKESYMRKKRKQSSQEETLMG